MKTYITIQGDTWDMIAYKMMGSEYYMDKLINANPRHINTAIFEAGIILIIPAIDIPVATNLPPWKR